MGLEINNLKKRILDSSLGGQKYSYCVNPLLFSRNGVTPCRSDLRSDLWRTPCILMSESQSIMYLLKLWNLEVVEGEPAMKVMMMHRFQVGSGHHWRPLNTQNFCPNFFFRPEKKKKGLWIKATAFSNTKKTNKLWEKKKSMVSERVHVSSIEILVRVFKTDVQNRGAWIGCTKQLGSCCQLH